MGGRLLIAGTHSGCGKTSITLGLLAALNRRGLRVAACKCGPDYIDPLFHREVLGVPSRNLDVFLCGEDIVRGLLTDSCRDSDIAVIEGVMGFYDGLAVSGGASSHHLSRCTDTPVILVADCAGMHLSLAAMLQGFLRFTPNNICGILLNRATERSYPGLKALVEEHCGVPVLGYLPRLPAAALESRHLGLVTAAEVAGLREKIDLLADAVAETVDMDALLALAGSAKLLEAELPAVEPVARVRIAVARDAAFCFLYEDNLRLLERLGAEILPFSPLEDTVLPENIHGLLLPGGYPELYAAQLAANETMRDSVRAAVEAGLPAVAECGGLLYLCRSLRTAAGVFPMAGAIDTDGALTDRLGRFGYVTLTARRDNILCAAGETLRGHEFHYSHCDNSGDAFRAEKESGVAWDCVHATDSLYAGYAHLHLWGSIGAARRFVSRCAAWKGAEK